MREHDNRLAIVLVTPTEIIGALNFYRGDHDCLVIPKIDGLPDGYRVVNVYFDWQYNAFAVCVHHESFAPVEGQIPVLNKLHSVRREILHIEHTPDEGVYRLPTISVTKNSPQLSAEDAARFRDKMNRDFWRIADYEEYSAPKKKPWEFLGAP